MESAQGNPQSQRAINGHVPNMYNFSLPEIPAADEMFSAASVTWYQGTSI